MSARGRTTVLRGALALALCSITSTAAADTGAVDPAMHGRVETTTSRWNAAGDAILTDAVVRTADGRQIVVTTPGGTVDGIGMSFSHTDAPLAADDEVTLVAKRTGIRALRVGASRATQTGTPGATAPRVGVQRTSRSLRALYHPTGCLEFVYDGDGTSKLSAEWDAVDAAFNSWESASQDMSCGAVRFSRRVMAHAPDGRDGTNTIHFRDTKWCRPGTLTEPEICHSEDAVAVTRMIFVDDPASARDGEILEVDIEVNAVTFTLATDGRATAIDLQSAMAHEIGHALGLDHNCGIETGAWPVGIDGMPVESCESASADLAAATMYFQVAPGTTTMRTPEANDTEGLCSVVTAECAVVVSGGCSAGTGGSNAAPLLFAGLFAGLLARRKRRAILLK